MRMHASWFGSQRPTGYKVAARTPRAATASSPRTRHPDHTERAAVLGSIKARPGNDGACGQRRATAGLDSPCARRPPTHVGRGEETGFQVEQKNWYEGSGECREIVLDFESPIQGRETGFQVEQKNWYEGSGECREIVLDFESPIQGRYRDLTALLTSAGMR